MDIDHAQVRLHAKWKQDKDYVKPPAPSPETPRRANLICSTSIKDELSFILFVDGKMVRQVGAASAEFLDMDPDALRKATLHMKSRPGFHVYYKQGPHWYGVPKHFTGLADAIPYIHTGLRVLVEYRFNEVSVKYHVLHGFETGPAGEQGKWREPLEICELYGVDPSDCLFSEYAGYLPPNGPLIVLRPLWQADWKQEPRADYDLQRRMLKTYGKLAPTK